MKRLIPLILLILLFTSLTEKKFKGGIFKTTNNKSVEQKIIELNDNGTFIGYQIVNGNPYHEGGSGQVAIIKTGKWTAKGQILIIKGINPLRGTRPKKYIHHQKIAAYYKEVCSQCPTWPIFDGYKVTSGGRAIDTINVINSNTISYRKEIYNRE